MKQAGDRNNRTIGTKYEQIALNYLQQANYEILESNYRSRTGEIDIVAKDGEYYVFVEVKYRTTTRSGHPAEAVDYRKQQKITNTARLYLYTHQLSEFTPCRFDVVVILGNTIELYKNAFEAI